MIKYLTLLFLLTGCISAPKAQNLDEVKAEISDLKQKIHTLEEADKNQNYNTEIDLCFTTYAICRVDAKEPKEACWKEHENCVVTIYRMYKKPL